MENQSDSLVGLDSGVDSKPSVAAINTKEIINMHNDDGLTYFFHRETLCNNGRDEAWYSTLNFQ